MYILCPHFWHVHGLSSKISLFCNPVGFTFDDTGLVTPFSLPSQSPSLKRNIEDLHSHPILPAKSTVARTYQHGLYALPIHPHSTTNQAHLPNQSSRTPPRVRFPPATADQRPQTTAPRYRQNVSRASSACTGRGASSCEMSL